MNIGVIIPTFNEEEIIADTIREVKNQAYKNESLQIIIADGGSSDQTIVRAGKQGVTVIEIAKRGRACQMNKGAEWAEADILYFLHADTHPPKHFDNHISKSVEQGNAAGCFQLSFDNNHYLLKFYTWFTRFDVNAFRFGDQSLFIAKNVFEEIGGFRDGHLFLEDQEIVRRIKRSHSFVILPQSVVTSARCYLRNGIVRLQFIFTLIFTLYYFGVPQQKLCVIYRKLVH